MQKSIKKVIAGAIAALMITSSMPIVASAAPGDYAPDIQLQFSSFFDANEQTDPTEKAASSADCFESAGLAAFPIQYDEATGTLTAKKEDINTYNEYWESDPVDEDWVIGEDDIFAVTIRIDNVNIAASGNINIRFSDNLSPAGLGTYTYKDGKKEKTGYIFCGDNTKPASFKNETAGFREPIATFSASTLYEGMNDTLIGDLSCIQEDPNAEDGDGWSDEMMTATLVCSGDYVDVSSIDASNGFFNIEDGSYDSDSGYTYDGKFIVATFVFQYSGEGPIQFALQDPTGEYDPQLNNACFFADKAEGQKVEDATTYAINRFVRTSAAEGYQGDETVAEWPGSAKMTFMGKNTNKGEEPVAHVHNYTSVVTPPTCEAQGYTTYTCQNDGCDNPQYIADYVDALGHTYAIDSVDWDTLNTETGKVTAHYICGRDKNHTNDVEVQTTSQVTQVATEEQVELTKFSYSEGDKSFETTVQTGEKLEHVHNYVPTVTNPTCTAQGYTTYTCACGDSYVADYVDPIAHTEGTAVKENDVPSTCNTLGGYDSVVYCTVCKNEVSRTHVDYTEYAAHTEGTAVKENDVPSTCNTLGGYDSVVYCTVCKNEVSRTHVDYTEYAAHTPAAAVDENVKPATKKDAGSKDVVVYCSVCHAEISRETVTTDPALGVNITVEKSDIGNVAGLAEGVNKLAYGETFTVTATPVEGATFVGWEISGNIVSKDATYSAKAVSDITITPVFEDQAAATITVTFFDKYGNTVKQYKDMEVADYQAAIAADIDNLVGPAYPSYEFKGWDKTKDEILALDASTTIWATYEKIEEAAVPKYTVTTNADVILPAGIVNGEIPYDTQVTVRDTAASAWKVGDTIVAYGTTYTFYVGSDVTVDPVYEAVDEKATTTVIGANLIAGSDYKFNIVATRNVPDGYTLTDYGFVYGKALTDAELDLDNVGKVAGSGATIKAVHAGTRNTESNEFAFNYGIKAKNAAVTAKSFIVVTKGEDTEIIYSDMFVQNY